MLTQTLVQTLVESRRICFVAIYSFLVSCLDAVRIEYRIDAKTRAALCASCPFDLRYYHVQFAETHFESTDPAAQLAFFHSLT